MLGIPVEEIVQLGVPAAICIYMITKAVPDLLRRSDAIIRELAERFDEQMSKAHAAHERVIDKIEANRQAMAKDGHDAARALGKAMESEVDAIRGNTHAIDRLSERVSKSGG